MSSAVSVVSGQEGELRFFFVHLHKTAGTSLWRRLSRQFSPAEMFPWMTDGDPLRRTISVDDLVERWPARRADVRVLAGHFPLCTKDLLGEPFVTFTVLRHPIERIVSALGEQRQKLTEFSDMSYEAVYREPLRRLMLRNHMVKMFSLTPTTMVDGALTDIDFTREHLDAAIGGLATVDHVGFQHDFESFCVHLAQQYSWELGDPVVDNRGAPVEVPQSVLERIAEDNALDIEFYDAAVRRYAVD